MNHPPTGVQNRGEKPKNITKDEENQMSSVGKPANVFKLLKYISSFLGYQENPLALENSGPC
jgi:hypothetical protein